MERGTEGREGKETRPIREHFQKRPENLCSRNSRTERSQNGFVEEREEKKRERRTWKGGRRKPLSSSPSSSLLPFLLAVL